MIFLVGDKRDPHISALKDKLGARATILDPSNELQTSERGIISFVNSTRSSYVLYDGRKITADDSFYLRQTRDIRTSDLPFDESVSELVADGQNRLMKALLYLSRDNPKKWINTFYAHTLAQDKMLQLRIARTLELSVPDTILTNSENEAVSFVQEYIDCIVKPIARTTLKRNDKNLHFYTRKIGPKENFKGLKNNPQIIQKRIDHIADIRVTVVGDKIFPVKIEASNTDVNESGLRDFRIYQANADTKYSEDLDFPNSIREKCIQLNKFFGLKYSAMDFVLDRNGNYHFLELNSYGAWLFCEQLAGVDISDEIVGMLEKLESEASRNSKSQ